MATNIITLEQYKQAKGIVGTKEDDRLNFLIPSVSQLIKTYCHNSFNDYLLDPYEEAFSIEYEGTNWVQLSESPIVELYSVETREIGEALYTTVESIEYVLDSKADMVKKIEGSWPVGVESVKVTYFAGYETLPSDLYLAAVDLVAYYLKEEYRQTKTLQGGTQRTPGSSSITENIGFPDHIRRVLDQYRHFE